MALPANAAQRRDPRSDVNWGMDAPPLLRCFLCGQNCAVPEYADHLMACEADWYTARHRQGEALATPRAPPLELVAAVAAGWRDKEVATRYNQAAMRVQPVQSPPRGDGRVKRRFSANEAHHHPLHHEAERDPEIAPGLVSNTTAEDAVVCGSLASAFLGDERPEDYEEFKKQLVVCPMCGRSFAADRLVVHQRSCKQMKKPVAKRPTGLPSPAEPTVTEAPERDLPRSNSRPSGEKRTTSSATVPASPSTSLGLQQRQLSASSSAFSSPQRRPAAAGPPSTGDSRVQRTGRPSSLTAPVGVHSAASSSATLYSSGGADSSRRPLEQRTSGGDRRSSRQSGVRPEVGRHNAGASEPPAVSSPKRTVPPTEGRSGLSLAQWMSSAAQELEFLQQQQQEYRNRSRQESRQLERGVMLRSRSRGPEIPSSILGGAQMSPPSVRGRTEERHPGTHRRSHSAALPPEDLDSSRGPHSPRSSQRAPPEPSPRARILTFDGSVSRHSAEAARHPITLHAMEVRARFCTQCGHQFDAPTMRFCPSCGTRRDRPAPAVANPP